MLTSPGSIMDFHKILPDSKSPVSSSKINSSETLVVKNSYGHEQGRSNG